MEQMIRNVVRPNKKEIQGLKKQVQKYDRLQTGASFLGFSKKKMKYIIRSRK